MIAVYTPYSVVRKLRPTSNWLVDIIFMRLQHHTPYLVIICVPVHHLSSFLPGVDNIGGEISVFYKVRKADSSPSFKYPRSFACDFRSLAVNDDAM